MKSLNAGRCIKIDEIGAYSVNVVTNQVTIGYDHIPRLISNVDDVIGIDLEEGMEEFKAKHNDKNLESLLKFIKMQCKFGSDLKEQIRADFVTNRGTIARFFTSTKTKFIAIRKNGVIFLYNTVTYGCSDSDVKRLRRVRKFDYITSAGNFRNPCENCEEVRVVFRATLKTGWRIYYNAKINGIDEDGNYVAKKINSKVRLDDSQKLSRRKNREHLPHFFSNTKTILRGIVNNQGTLVNIEREDVDFALIVGQLPILEHYLMLIRCQLRHDEMAVNIFLQPDRTLLFEPLHDCSLVPDDFLDQFS
ncbi:unnamed protein product [Caenorhabditis bovis]|uniref:Decapping nuclease n=1 Tax=Caenorhabditis bovis TaxID=2654633 RepID=A0A8S1F1R1_9PELO|nr:unnamed protein product [Caenorhabditis bovis]